MFYLFLFYLSLFVIIEKIAIFYSTIHIWIIKLTVKSNCNCLL
ncbi:hypothetical protein HMPREF3226_02115 [Prevotella corporis]|uniref:Uncharacterized protein n=1 Tax=Prevotella corporis TaxID=28128 RepID=A0A133PYT8_9BACT|nr:hypothetical protein HMPREF3226_02115 [Prevotella corporis]